MRKWLNGDFCESAFSSSEQGAIIESSNSNPNNPRYDTAGGEPTKDKVFLLSIDESKSYGFKGLDEYDTAREAKATVYAKAKGLSVSTSDGAWWWLRSPGMNSYHASQISNYGKINYAQGDMVEEIKGIRPAIKVNASSALVKIVSKASSGADKGTTGTNTTTKPATNNAGTSNKKTVKKGSKFSAGNLTYKVTSAKGKKYKAKVVKVVKKSCKSITIKGTVKYGGKKIKVTGISKKFASGCKKLKVIKIKSKYIKKVSKKSFKGIKSKYKIKKVKSKKKK